MIVKEAEAKILEEPQPQMLSGVPSGSLMHRTWRYPRLDKLRKSSAGQAALVRRREVWLERKPNMKYQYAWHR